MVILTIIIVMMAIKIIIVTMVILLKIRIMIILIIIGIKDQGAWQSVVLAPAHLQIAVCRGTKSLGSFRDAASNKNNSNSNNSSNNNCNNNSNTNNNDSNNNLRIQDTDSFELTVVS